MFVQPSRLVTQGAFVVGLAALGSACDAPTLSTDLRPEGDPEVLSVLVMNDADFGILEFATFCKINDAKRPGLLGTPVAAFQICDEDLSLPAEQITDAVPSAWHVRIMFDELLDPTVEELIPILDPDTQMETGQFNGSLATTQPVTLQCAGVDVDYDGHYGPNGNAVTFPLGPSLFIAPLDPAAVAAGSECTVALRDTILDKDGNQVPADQRNNPSYKFGIAPLAFLGTTPARNANPANAPQIAPTAAVSLNFNGFIKADTLAVGEVTITELAVADCATTAGTVVPAVIGPNAASPLRLSIKTSDNGGVAANAWKPASAYTISFAGGNDGVTDQAGGTAALPAAAAFTLCFKTRAS